MKQSAQNGYIKGQLAIKSLPGQIGHGVGYTTGFTAGVVVGASSMLWNGAKSLVPCSVKRGFRSATLTSSSTAPLEEQPATPPAMIPTAVPA